MDGFWGNMFGANGSPFGNFANSEYGFAGQYSPWVQQGQNANNWLYNQDKRAGNNPASVENQIASGWQSSPYQSNLLNQTTNRLNMNAANTGMLGSPSANQYLAGQLNDMTGQFENQYVQNGLNTYDTSLNSMNDIANRGMGALGGQAGLQEEAAAGQLKQQQQNNSFWPNMIGQVGGYLNSNAEKGAQVMGGSMGGGFGGAGGMMSGMGGGGMFGGSQSPYGQNAGYGANQSWGGTPYLPGVPAYQGGSTYNVGGGYQPSAFSQITGGF